MSLDRPADQSSAPTPATAANRRKPKRVLLGLLAAALAGGLIWGGHWYLQGRFIESTDDAYLQADSMTVSPKIGGYVAEVLVADNQRVEAGQPLARLDTDNYRVSSEKAAATVAAREADVLRAEAELAQQDATIAQNRADVAGAEADLSHSKAQVKRYAPLARSGAETEERLADLNNEQARATATLAAKKAALRASEVRVGTLKAQLQQTRAQLAEAKANARQSDIDLGDTLLRSPIAGSVAGRSVRVGQFAQPGTRLMTIVPLQAIYLVANFKETQIGQMRAGQSVKVHIDALPGHELSGHIDSLSPGTGAQFALLPPSNATGNFTKIVQRVPVRIVLDLPEELRPVVMPGLSVTVDVDTRSAGNDQHG
ncbi:HlyD family secretion protein [Pseudomonas sp. 3A(2025)]